MSEDGELRPAFGGQDMIADKRKGQSRTQNPYSTENSIDNMLKKLHAPIGRPDPF